MAKPLKSLDSSNLRSPLFREVTPKDGSGISRRAYEMTRDGFTLLAMGFSGRRALEFKLRYIEAFKEMEEALRQRVPVMTLAETQAMIEGSIRMTMDTYRAQAREDARMIAQEILKQEPSDEKVTVLSSDNAARPSPQPGECADTAETGRAGRASGSAQKGDGEREAKASANSGGSM